MSNTSSDEGRGKSADEAVQAKLDELRVEFGRTIQRYFPTLFVLTVLIATSLVVLIAVGFGMNKTMEATVLAASVQVAFGMVLGFVCVYIGLMMTWVGIDAAYSVKGDVGAGSVALKSASPGLLFALGGMLLVGVSLYKRIEYQEGGLNLVDTRSVSPAVPGGAVAPAAPAQMHVEPTGTVPSSSAPQGLSPFAAPQTSPPDRASPDRNRGTNSPENSP